ncbi:hypothetical protein CDES_08585 [Corynebacterium deserti GIMN1.010]|uniref:DUF4192 domain-containing protein n=1 Tax=Corynebacterium deserti GIMN1.010 TaxID=931089 RepID=A0A0M4CM95_9CORY|nr:DUF4192 domain-containing protein [Corynebacterium deserti]ALC06110.1 hypothetical protein CDES_08585 [Corynebacterium deserti GIMN1.010]
MSANASNNTDTTVLESPGGLLANIPGILGFYPTDSVVLACMTDQEDSQVTLGPLVRFDADNLHQLPDIAHAIDNFNPALIFAFIVSTQLSPAQLDETLDQLYHASESGLLNIAACWYAKEITSGEPYYLCFGPEIFLCEQHSAGETDWEFGRIPPITSAAATQKMLQEGHLPEVNRKEALAVTDTPNPHITTAKATALAKTAAKNATKLTTAIHKDHTSTTFQQAIDDFETLLRTVEATYLDPSTHADHLDALLLNTAILEQTATYFSESVLRDAVLHLCVEHARPAALLLLATARTFSGGIRSNAICLYALSLINLDLAMKAVPAVQSSIDANPEHNLSLLIRDGLLVGQTKRIVDACLRGNEQLRYEYLHKDEENPGCRRK